MYGTFIVHTPKLRSARANVPCAVQGRDHEFVQGARTARGGAPLRVHGHVVAYHVRSAHADTDADTDTDGAKEQIQIPAHRLRHLREDQHGAHFV